MKKIAINFLAVLFISALSFTKAFAVDMTLGVSGAIVNLQAEGSETETGSQTAETTPASVSNTFATGSIFAEAQFGRLAFGVDYIPGTADVNRTTLSRTDTTADANEGQQQDGKRTANAELSDHITYYAELGKMNGIYGKVGFAQVDVATKDTETHAGTSGLYPDKTLDAWTYALGYKGEWGERGVFKIEGFMTDYDGYKATNNSGKTSTKTVTADLDVVGASLRIGLKF